MKFLKKKKRMKLNLFKKNVKNINKNYRKFYIKKFIL